MSKEIPNWYTTEEMTRHLRCELNIEEVAAKYAANLQKAFAKGFDIGFKAGLAASSPVTDNPQEDAFYEKVEKAL